VSDSAEDRAGESAEPAEGGEGPALEASEVLPLVYDELRSLARRRMAQERVGHTMGATALVHEAYMRLAGPMRFANRGHFFAAEAEAMRRILIDHARTRGRTKRGGGAKRMPLSVLDLAACPEAGEILAFDEAISRLEKESPAAASVVRLRFYAGLSIDETAEALDISPRTVDREWTYARAWLYGALEKERG
jgi:RNA polymerase sigma factor (TIGR02999 family)